MLPSGITRDAPRTPGTTQLSSRWLHPIHVFFPLFFTAAWIAIGVGGLIVGAPVALWRLLAPTNVLALPLLYYAAAVLLNRADITLDAEALRVTHGPLPWPSASIRRAEIAGVEHTRFSQKDPRRILSVVRHDGSRKWMLTGMGHEAAAFATADPEAALDGR